MVNHFLLSEASHRGMSSLLYCLTSYLMLCCMSGISKHSLHLSSVFFMLMMGDFLVLTRRMSNIPWTCFCLFLPTLVSRQRQSKPKQWSLLVVLHMVLSPTPLTSGTLITLCLRTKTANANMLPLSSQLVSTIPTSSLE